ncbi:conjugal transfer protein TraF [Photobacterium sp. ZSDE20]|uniref:Conjugal transfer protein TraF n=1 Tax=Photobacterium pectinilyticum TaxID=2906793 RepID=A0ABT1N3J9_9GAMM|nr:conjugal transfer protein TraF [Photobacterium sp. ZSDE20]MCQ1059323.1 conjugal transfer protein TraF [Photobacterium sp. ZSDE20]MDD1825582.1 conjugal transfer protein TraF [Photobacterium sp. ZSDE20]
MVTVKRAAAGIAMAFLSYSAAASNTLSDTRSVGMGGVGVASANYLTASFHNPALATQNKRHDSFGMILPVIGAQVYDGNDLHDRVDAFQDLNDQLAGNPDLVDEWTAALKDLDDGRIDGDVNVGMVVAIPNRMVSTNFFISSNVTALVLTDIDEDDIANHEVINSTGQAVAGGTVDIGFTFAKEFIFLDRDLSLGVSPKLQQLMAFNYKQGIDTFDDDDIDIGSDYVDKSAFNADIGAAYALSRNVMLGLSVQNVFSQSLTSNESSGNQVTYEVEAQYTTAFAYNHPRFTVAADVDLNSNKPFKEQAYKTQFARIGIEADAWRVAQLRLGYIHSMTDFSDDLFTAGIGLKPFGKFGLDIAAIYGNEDNYGASAQLVFHF